jgi:hypothetical protein
MARPSNRFKQTITFKVVTGVGDFGARTLGSASTAAARVEPTSKRVKNDQGDDVLASHIVYTEAALTKDHRVWFPGEDTANRDKARVPIAVQIFVDGNGVESYRKAWF